MDSAPHPISTKVWIALATVCTCAALGSFLLTAWLELNPCHLCIFQRTLFMLLALLAALAAVADRWVRSVGAQIISPSISRAFPRCARPDFPD